VVIEMLVEVVGCIVSVLMCCCVVVCWQVLPVEFTRLPLLEKLYLDNNRLSVLPPELGQLKNLKVLSVDNNMLVSVPGKYGLVWMSQVVCSCIFV